MKRYVVTVEGLANGEDCFETGVREEALGFIAGVLDTEPQASVSIHIEATQGELPLAIPAKEEGHPFQGGGAGGFEDPGK